MRGEREEEEDARGKCEIIGGPQKGKGIRPLASFHRVFWFFFSLPLSLSPPSFSYPRSSTLIYVLSSRFLFPSHAFIPSSLSPLTISHLSLSLISHLISLLFRTMAAITTTVKAVSEVARKAPRARNAVMTIVREERREKVQVK